MDKVIHFEIPVDDLVRAKNFYKTVFGWGLTSVPEMEYTLIQTVEVDESTQMPKEAGAINGGMMQRADPFQNPIITVHVENIDAAMKQIESLGGKIVQGKMEVPNMGITAYFQDTEGNVLGLWQDLKKP